jgi:hypothetical protein
VAVEGSAILDVLCSLLASRTDVALPGAGERDGTSETATPALLVAFSAASRRAGKVALVLDDDETSRLRAAAVDWPLATRVDELWRIAMLVAVAVRADVAALVAECFRGGDTDERCAVLRALPLLPDAARFAPLAADACRTSVRPIFEAIACENPYPARYLAALHFDQMVLKALFLDVPLMRIRELDRRRTPELCRMARDYAAERRAAGRLVSDDLAALAAEDIVSQRVAPAKETP